MNEIEKARMILQAAELRKNGDVVIKSPIHYGSKDGKEILSITADECMRGLMSVIKEATEREKMKCENCRWWIDKNDVDEKMLYSNVLNHDGLCDNMTIWLDNNDFCSHFEPKERD